MTLSAVLGLVVSVVFPLAVIGIILYALHLLREIRDGVVARQVSESRPELIDAKGGIE